MSKIIVLGLVSLSILFGISGCGSSDDGSDNSSSNQTFDLRDYIAPKVDSVFSFDMYQTKNNQDKFGGTYTKQYLVIDRKIVEIREKQEWTTEIFDNKLKDSDGYYKRFIKVGDIIRGETCKTTFDAYYETKEFIVNSTKFTFNDIIKIVSICKYDEFSKLETNNYNYFAKDKGFIFGEHQYCELDKYNNIKFCDIDKEILNLD